MTAPLFTCDVCDPALLDAATQHTALHVMEQGNVVYFPHYCMPLPAKNLLGKESLLDGTHKSISYNPQTQKLGGVNTRHSDRSVLPELQTYLQGYYEWATHLVQATFPHYIPALIAGRTSFRPVEIQGRSTSRRHDDTRLHVDSFPATPVGGNRILRVFCNVNPFDEVRVWHLGEPFHAVLSRFAPRIGRYRRWHAHLLKSLRITKQLRTAYDHYQLSLHDAMKHDDVYQQQVPKTRMDFPAQSSWLVFTDNVSHAALSGRFLLEQTFYLPVDAMKRPEDSPFEQWKRVKG